MANLLNLDAESGANMIGDDAQPTLRITNSSTGPGLSTDRLLVTSAATIASVSLTSITGLDVTITSNATNSNPMFINKTPIGAPSAALLKFQSSVVSQSVLSLLAHSFVSAVSIVFAASANWAGMGAIRIQHGADKVQAWIPVIPDGVVTAAAV